MFCASCGKQLCGGEVFCPNCGAKIQHTPTGSAPQGTTPPASIKIKGGLHSFAKGWTIFRTLLMMIIRKLLGARAQKNVSAANPEPHNIGGSIPPESEPNCTSGREEQFTFAAALKIIFKYTQTPPAVLAEQYVDRDRTLVYKWLRGAVSPPKKLFPGIIKFVMEQSSEEMRTLMRSEMEQCLSETVLDMPLGKTTDREIGFTEYLENVFNLLAIEKARQKNGHSSVEQNQPEIHIANEHKIPIWLTYPAVKCLGFLLLAAVTGEILWAIIAFVLRWPSTVGGPYNGALVFPAMLKGFLILPIIVFSIVSLRREYSFIRTLSKSQNMIVIFSYALTGGIAGVLLASPGLEGLVGRFLTTPVPQALFLVFIHGLVLSFLPLCVLWALFRFPRITTSAFLVMEFCPALLCVLAAWPVLFLGWFPEGRVWLGGFFPALVLNISMYLSARMVLAGNRSVTQ
ncbi:MAG: zinc ribbon domain-containing protein [Firmicutes bacterium]|nr:zinc ribbon domain-containing protein [Bacillota bacterium]